MAAIVLTPILVPAATPIEVSVPIINGNRKTPKISPTIPPTKPITKPMRPRIGIKRIGSMTGLVNLRL